jgi:vacuolar-type H+-ATPase subunit F/Vma7
MSRALAIGRVTRLAGYALSGAEVVAAEDASAVTRALETLPEDVALVILDEQPGTAVRAALERHAGTVWCTLPTRR